MSTNNTDTKRYVVAQFIVTKYNDGTEAWHEINLAKRSARARETAKSQTRDDRGRFVSQRVTPDHMVTCPKCGTKIRVGKKLG